ncbi:MAG: FAD-dependent oxidoreductase [Rhodospirillales bacterium]|nr:FAD-dependent oxidoreductase [Rhodospirillales bacterium]
MDDIDCVVIGAGVVGLAAARALACSGREVIIVETETVIGSGISSRNSEVIHAGIYYPEGSLKARLCVSGRTHLYGYCIGRHIAHQNCGKLIVATSSGQISELEAIKRAAEANGVDDLIWLDGDQVKRLEPAISCVCALLSPSTGIVDSHSLLLSLLGEAADAGAVIAYATTVTKIVLEDDGAAIWVNGEREPSLRARLVVNAAGLGAISVARKMRGFPAKYIPQQWLAKGSYFTLSGSSPFSRLIYPVPDPGGLGVHVTIDLGGQVRFGPDVEWTDRLDFSVDPQRAVQFYDAIRAYWPNLPAGALEPGYAGIRPKLSGPGHPAADFCIDGASTHGMQGIINLFGIESPGLTAALAIADEVVQLSAEARRA